jgi:hypothetical protein
VWREIAHGILFRDGDIVEHGEEAEAAADDDGDPAAAGSTSLDIGSLKGADA